MSEQLKKDIADIITPHAGGDERLAELLALSVGRILCRDARRSDRPDAETLRHIADWLKAALVNDAPWLSNLDKDGCPKKLMKLHSFAACTAEADKEMLRSVTRRVRIDLIEGDEEHYTNLDDGYSLVRLLTPAALDREGVAMQHCIGDGAYDEELEEKALYLSLRDPAGKPHATLEVRAGKLLQLQGKQNEAAIQRYLDLLIPFLKKTKWGIAVPANRLGQVIDAAGSWHPIDDLPEGLSVSGDLDLCGSQITALPEGLSVGGYLELSDTQITALPEGLSVGGGLYLSGTQVTALPERLSVGGSLYLCGTQVATLPERLSVGGSLYLSGTPITALPEGLSVGGGIDLSDTPITTLPERLSVGGSLYLCGSQITALPERLSVRGGISLSGTQITALPEGLSAGGYIDISGTRISALPGSILNDAIILCDVGGMITAMEFREMHGTEYDAA